MTKIISAVKHLHTNKGGLLTLSSRQTAFYGKIYVAMKFSTINYSKSKQFVLPLFISDYISK